MVEETIPGAPDPASPGVTVPPTTIMVPEEVPTPSFDSFCGTHLSCRWQNILLIVINEWSRKLQYLGQNLVE